MSLKNSKTTFQKNNKSKGRPKGSKNKATQALIALQNIEQANVERVLNNLLKACDNGDMSACKIIYDKVRPNPKPGSLPRPILDLSTLKTPEDYKTMSDQILNAGASGQCSLEESGELNKQLIDNFNHIYKEVVA